MNTTTARQDALTDGKPSASVVAVTPDVAARWLGKNLRNRNVRASHVHNLARDMAAGRWQITGEAIKFATTGELIDGQHRLHAVIESGATVMLFVVRGLAPSAQDVMDTGSKRSSSDMLGLHGHKNSTTIAAAARLALHIGTSSDTRAVRSTFTHTEIAQWVENHPEVESAASAAMALKGYIEASPSVLTVAWMWLSKADPQACADFFNSIAQSQTQGLGDPRSALIKRLAHARRNSERLTATAQLSFIVRAWNAWRKGEQLTILRAKAASSKVADGATHVVIPRPL